MPAGETAANLEENEDAGSQLKSQVEDAQDVRSQSALSQHRLDQKSVMQSEVASIMGGRADREPTQAEIFDEFLAQVSFKRCTEI